MPAHVQHEGAYQRAIANRIRRNGVKGRLDRLVAAETDDDALMLRFVNEIVEKRGRERLAASNERRERTARRQGWDFEPDEYYPLLDLNRTDLAASWIASLGWDEMDDWHFEQSIALRYVKSPKGLSDKMRALVARMLDEEPQREQKARERREAIAAANAGSEHVGEVGQRLTDIEVVIEFIKSIEGYYGTKRLVKMRDADGNVLVTFSTSSWVWTAQRGDKFRLTGTVKGHDTYEGTKQTTLTRCKAEEIS